MLFIRTKLDEILKYLFHSSDNLIINVINHIFKEKFSYDAKISYGNIEFIKDDLSRIVGDILIIVFENNQRFLFHIEFQTLNDSSMIIRMIRYGFYISLENITNFDEKTLCLEFPKQSVIFIEENSNISNTLKCILEFPNNQKVNYEINVMRYWEYDIKKIEQEKLYLLLPLQVFKFRKKIDAFLNSNKDESVKRVFIKQELAKLLPLSEDIARISKTLFENNEITGIDLGKISVVLQNLSDYLYDRYDLYSDVKKDVNTMLTDTLDPVRLDFVRKEGHKEGALQKSISAVINALNYGLDVDVVSKIQDIPLAYVIQIQKLINEKKSVIYIEKEIMRQLVHKK